MNHSLTPAGTPAYPAYPASSAPSKSSQSVAARAASYSPEMLGAAAAAFTPQPKAVISSQAAREMLLEHQDRLGGILGGVLRHHAGPVKR